LSGGEDSFEDVDFDELSDSGTEELDSEIDELGSGVDELKDHLGRLHYRIEKADDERDEMARNIAVIYRALEEIDKKMTRRTALGGLAGLFGLGGLAGLGANYLGSSESDPEWQSSYEVLIEDGLGSIADEFAVSDYERINRLGNGLREALDDHDEVALGFDPVYGDIGVRGNNWEDWTLEERVDLEDPYDLAKRKSSLSL
jgi:molybdopterin converting factor small subunit